MKVLIALATLAISVSIYASDSAIYDIMYLPNLGTNFGFSEVEFVRKGVKADGGDLAVSGYGLTQTIGRSMSNRLTVAGSFGYGNFKLDPENDPNTKQDGMSDPTFAIRYRALDEDFILDIVGGTLLSFGDSKQEADGDTDNLQGGHAVFIGAQVGKKSDNFQWAILGEITQNLARTVDIEDVGDIDIDPTKDLLLKADILKKLKEKNYLRSFLSMKFMEELKATDENDTIDAANSIYTIGTEYQYLYSQEILLRGGVEYTSENYNSGIVESDNNWTLRLAANYQF